MEKIRKYIDEADRMVNLDFFLNSNRQKTQKHNSVPWDNKRKGNTVPR